MTQFNKESSVYEVRNALKWSYVAKKNSIAPYLTRLEQTGNTWNVPSVSFHSIYPKLYTIHSLILLSFYFGSKKKL